MTEVTTLNPSTSPLDTGTAASVVADSAQEVNDRFLKLLVAQMNNQDPLNPLDNAQVTSQMAQINTVSGINNLNETVQSLLASYARLEVMQAAQLTGRTVLVTGNALVPTADADGNPVATGAVQLAQPADEVTVEIRDAGGLLVRTLDLGALDAGIQRFDWDGTGDAGAPVAAGRYSFTIKATAAGKEIGAAPLAAGRVEGVRQDAAGTQLILAGLGPVAYTDIQQIL